MNAWNMICLAVSLASGSAIAAQTDAGIALTTAFDPPGTLAAERPMEEIVVTAKRPTLDSIEESGVSAPARIRIDLSLATLDLEPSIDPTLEIIVPEPILKHSI